MVGCCIGERTDQVEEASHRRSAKAEKKTEGTKTVTEGSGLEAKDLK